MCSMDHESWLESPAMPEHVTVNQERGGARTTTKHDIIEMLFSGLVYILKHK